MLSTIHSFFQPSENEDIPYPDLDNFKIEELSEEQIVKIFDYGGGIGIKTRAQGNSSGLSSKVDYKDSDYTTVEVSYKKKNGISTIQSTRAENTTLTLDIKSKLEEGSAKIFIIKNSEIVESFECGEDKQFIFKVDEESIFCVKGAFANAKGVEITVCREFDEQ